MLETKIFSNIKNSLSGRIVVYSLAASLMLGGCTTSTVSRETYSQPTQHEVLFPETARCEEKCDEVLWDYNKGCLTGYIKNQRAGMSEEYAGGKSEDCSSYCKTKHEECLNNCN